MGTRLYITADNATLELICAAPEGAWAKMEAICAQFPGHSDAEYDRREAEFDKVDGAGRCHDFDLFGFGKLNSEQWGLVKEITADEDDMYCGSSEDPRVISKMLLLSSSPGSHKAWLNKAKITKVSWS
jgi:hypothetical protein